MIKKMLMLLSLVVITSGSVFAQLNKVVEKERVSRPKSQTDVKVAPLSQVSNQNANFDGIKGKKNNSTSSTEKSIRFGNRAENTISTYIQEKKGYEPGAYDGLVTDYDFTYSSGTYTPITVGTVSGIDASTNFQNITLPFSFNYDNVDYTTARISLYGWLELGQDYTNAGLVNDLASTTMKPFLCPLWDALRFRGTSEIMYKTVGASPNRIFIVQWKNMGWNSNNKLVNFQLHIYETTLDIEFHYGYMQDANSRSASIGINDNTGGSGHFISVTPGSPPTPSTTSANNSIDKNTYPGNGVIYKFGQGYVPTAITNFPWEEGFENGGSMPIKWAQSYETGSVDWIYTDGGHSDGTDNHPATAHTGDYNAQFFSSTPGQVTKLISPPLDLSGLTNPVLTFYHAQEFWDPDQDELTLYYRTSTAGPWVQLQNWDTDTPQWKREVFVLPNKSSLYYIAFEGTGNNGYGVCVDNVRVSDMNLWNGSVSTDWGTANNWSHSSLPVSTDDVLIPSGLSNYPVLDEEATCNELLILDGASVIIDAGSDVIVGGDMYVGNGTTGIFEINAGRCAIAGNFYCFEGCAVDINGGILGFNNWSHDPGDNWAKGTFGLTGGVVTVSESVYFSISEIAGTMSGTFAMSVGADMYIGDDLTSPFWNITGGTITMMGTGTSGFEDNTYFWESPNTSYESVAWNLVINATGQNYHLSHSQFTQEVNIKNNLTVTAGTALTHSWNKATSNTAFEVEGVLTVASGATFVHADVPAATFDVKDFALDASSNYLYDCSLDQTLLSQPPNYGNLSTTGSGLCTANGNTVVSGNFLANGNVDFNDFNYTIAGDATIGTGVTVSAGIGTIIVNGNWTDNGTFNYETSTVAFEGTSDSDVSGTGGISFPTGNFATQFTSSWQYVSCYFDLTASGGEDLSIDAFDINADGTETVYVQIWYYPLGSYVGHTGSTDGWVQLGTTQTLTAQLNDTPTYVNPGSSVALPSGSTYGFFISCYDINDDSKILFSEGTNTTYNDSYLTIGVGASDDAYTAGTGTNLFTDDDRWDGTVYYTGTGNKFLPFYDVEVAKDNGSGAVNVNDDVEVNNKLTISTGATLNVSTGIKLNVDGEGQR